MLGIYLFTLHGVTATWKLKIDSNNFLEKNFALGLLGIKWPHILGLLMHWIFLICCMKLLEININKTLVFWFLGQERPQNGHDIRFSRFKSKLKHHMFVMFCIRLWHHKGLKLPQFFLRGGWGKPKPSCELKWVFSCFKFV